MNGWRDLLEWLLFCLIVEAVVACFTGAAVVHDSHQFGVRTMGVGALITAGILIFLLLIVYLTSSDEDAA